MAKMFYTLDEVCSKLGKDDDEVKRMVQSGQIQEFRDRDNLMFNVEQIDLLAAGEEDTSDVHLELDDTGGGLDVPMPEDSSIGLADSREGTGLIDAGASGSGSIGGSGLGLADSREAMDLADSREGTGTGTGTGVSVFDTDHGGEESDKTAAGEVVEEELGLDAVGSGSGLLDLTRESDDTSLGAELLEEVYASEENVELPAHASGLFEAAAVERPGQEVTPATVPAGLPMMVEAYDGAGSGLGAGLLIGAVASLVCVAIIAIVGTGGATPMLAMKMASNESSIWIWSGVLLAITVILGLIGLFIGKASE